MARLPRGAGALWELGAEVISIAWSLTASTSTVTWLNLAAGAAEKVRELRAESASLSTATPTAAHGR